MQNEYFLLKKKSGMILPPSRDNGNLCEFNSKVAGF
jgi:hypothetical protein